MSGGSLLKTALRDSGIGLATVIVAADSKFGTFALKNGKVGHVRLRHRAGEATMPAERRPVERSPD
jgi:hypothetical protein